MPRGKAKEDTTMLHMALLGYESEKQRIEEKIAELRSRIGGRPVSSASTATKKKASTSHDSESSQVTGRRTLSPAARKRIAAAQKKRWAEHRKRLAASPKE